MGNNITRDGEIQTEVLCHIAKAARALKGLRKPLFQNAKLSLATKHPVYCVAVLMALLYQAETWTIKAEYTKYLNTLHNRSVRTILIVTRYIPAVERANFIQATSSCFWNGGVNGQLPYGPLSLLAWPLGCMEPGGKGQSSYHLVNWRRGGLVMAQGRNGGLQ